jgi:LacI family transcriptional regulator
MLRAYILAMQRLFCSQLSKKTTTLNRFNNYVDTASMENQEKKPTIRDVAARAGVSTGTVSAVLNNRATVREETRRRVLEVMRRLDYTPSIVARRLSGAEGPDLDLKAAVGFVVKEMENPFYAEVVTGAREVLTGEGYLTFVVCSDGDFGREGKLIEALQERSLGGVIIAPVLHEEVDLSHLFQLRRTGFPFVLLENVQGLHANVVSVNNVEASQLAVTHLLEGGHQRIIHLAGPSYTQHSRDRILGVERAFSHSPVCFRADCIIPAGATFREGYEVGLRYFRECGRDRPTAVTCFNDLVAMGLLRALAELGLRVPEDVSVVGFDDIPAAAYFSVPLTTINVPKRRMGRVAARRLLELLSTDDPAAQASLMLQAVLVERASTSSISSASR